MWRWGDACAEGPPALAELPALEADCKNLQRALARALQCTAQAVDDVEHLRELCAARLGLLDVELPDVAETVEGLAAANRHVDAGVVGWQLAICQLQRALQVSDDNTALLQELLLDATLLRLEESPVSAAQTLAASQAAAAGAGAAAAPACDPGALTPAAPEPPTDASWGAVALPLPPP